MTLHAGFTNHSYKGEYMTQFPRTQIENLSVSRLIIGTNWFLGFSHTSKAKDRQINETMDRQHIAEVLEVFLKAGVDTLLGMRPEPKLVEAVKDAEDRTGRQCITIAIPHLNLAGTQEADSENAYLFDEYAALGVSVCMPHQVTTDALVDRHTRQIRDMQKYVAMIRERGMIPGLSTHMPETPIYADETGLDVATYIQIYNAAGFLMQIEVDWVYRMIWERKNPVITIKPLAAGRLMPLVGLAFSWSTLRSRDMVAIGTMTPYEAEEVIELSLSVLEHRKAEVNLQWTRSKASVDTK
jgi:hypothetical protein